MRAIVCFLVGTLTALTFGQVWFSGFPAEIKQAEIKQAAIDNLPEAYLEFPCIITRVLDGDTAEVEVKFKFHVRFMLGDKFLDAPEKNTAQGQASLNRLRDYALGQPCMMRMVLGPLQTMMNFERVKGELTLFKTPDESLSEWLVKSKLAVPGKDR